MPGELPLDSPFDLRGPNDPILLHEGTFLLAVGNQAVEGEGTASFEWQPTPRVRFKFDSSKAEPIFDFGDSEHPTTLTTPDGALKVEDPLLTSMSFGSDGHKYEVVCGDATFGHWRDIRRLTFHVANLSPRDDGILLEPPPDDPIPYGWSGRVSFSIDDEWSLTLDSRHQAGTWFSPRTAFGGYAVSHIGELGKLSRERIVPSDFERLRRALDYLWSLLRGDWCNPVLWCGFDSEDALCWQEWRSPKLSSYRSRFSPVPTSAAAAVSLAQKVVTRFREPDQTLEWVLSFYLDANGGGAENGTILSQAGLELLAWQVLVIEQGVVTPEAFERRLTAADAIRLLLVSASALRPLPQSLANLAAAPNAVGATDVPELITAVRNAMVHPKDKESRRWVVGTPGVRIDASWLALWALEVCLLRYLDYDGAYIDRTEGFHETTVPWGPSVL